MWSLVQCYWINIKSKWLISSKLFYMSDSGLKVMAHSLQPWSIEIQEKR